jgi:hypothetical protein
MDYERTNDEKGVSHGICIPCGVKVLGEQGIDPTEFIIKCQKEYWHCKGIYSDE